MKKKSRAEFFKKARERSGFEINWFQHHRKSRTHLIFETVVGQAQAKIKSFRIFDFDISIRGRREPLKLPKIKTFTISAAEDQEYLKDHIKVPQATRAKGQVPQEGAANKAPVPEGLIEKAIAEDKQLAIMLLNGTILVGVPVKESTFSILLKVPDSNGREIFVFKHGLIGIRLYEEIQPPG